LDQDLQKYLDEAPDGVIYFSMGSNLRSTSSLNLKGMPFWKRSRRWSSMCYGSGRVTLCQDNRATWNSVNGCLNLTFWVSVDTLVRPLAYHACETVVTVGSGYEVHWLPFRWNICL